MKVPFFRPRLTEQEIERVVAALRSGWLTTGPNVKEFEQSFAELLGVKHAVALNSCTAALHLALEAVGVQEGDCVVVPTLTFAATAEVVRYFNAVPVFVDIDEETLCLDTNALEATVEGLQEGKIVGGLAPPHGPVRALIPMHYGGQMADMDHVGRVAKKHDIAVVEDAAHTLPAYYRSPDREWQAAGTMSDVGCFSFYANKCITTGEGGMAVTDRDDWADRIRLMSLHGMSRDAWQRYQDRGHWYYEIVAAGYKYNMTDLAAAIGVGQLERVDALWASRARVARRYGEHLSDVAGLVLPTELENRQHAWHLYSIRVREDAGWPVSRNRTIEILSEQGIGTSVHWMPLHLQPFYRERYGYSEGVFPRAERVWQELISLPIFPDMHDEEIDYVSDVLLRIGGGQIR